MGQVIVLTYHGWRTEVQQLAHTQSLAKPGLHGGLSDIQAWVIPYPPPRLQGQEGERTLNAQIKSSLSAKVASGERGVNRSGS